MVSPSDYGVQVHCLQAVQVDIAGHGVHGFALGLAGTLRTSSRHRRHSSWHFCFALATLALADGIGIVLRVNGVGKLALGLGLRTIVSRVTAIRAFASHVRPTTNEAAAVLALAFADIRRAEVSVAPAVAR